MKKFLFVAVLAFASVMAYAQPRAIGGRLGEFCGFSYEHGFGDSNMLEIEAGFNFGNPWGNRMVGWENGQKWNMHGHNVQVAVTYDWIDPFNAKFPTIEKGEWHWYMGVGGSGGIYGFNAPNWYVGAAGHFGIEYDFWFPLQLSLDWRPSIGVGLAGANGQVQAQYNTGGLYQGISLGVRYKF